MIAYIVETTQDEIPSYLSFVGSEEAMLTHDMRYAHLCKDEEEANKYIKGNEEWFKAVKVKVEFEAV